MKKVRSRHLQCCMTLAPLLAAAILVRPAQAVELEPYEFVGAPPGTTAFLGYAIYGHSDRLNIVDAPLHVGEDNLNVNLGIARLAHYFNVGDTLALVEVLQPFGSINNVKVAGAQLSSSSGLGDAILAAALWPVNDKTNQTYFGVTLYVTVPNGEYDKLKPINLGGHRYSYDPQLAFFKGVGEHWAVEASGDAIFYGDNDRAGALGRQRLTQEPTLQFQAFVDYKWANGFTASLGYEGLRGGVQKLDDVDNGFRTHSDKIRFVTSKFVAPKTQIMGEVNHQFDVKGGFRQDVGAVVRLLRVF